MKFTILTLVLLLSFQFTQAQSSTDLTNFNKIQIKGNLEVNLIAADQADIQIETGEDHRVEYEIVNEQLLIKHKELYKYKSYRDFPIQVTISYKELIHLDVRAGARVRAENSIAGTRIDVHLGSGAQLKADIQTMKIDVDVAEGAVAKLSGRVARFTAIASTGGRLEAFEMDAEDSRIRSSMGGVAEVNAVKSLDAQANMGGEIYYRGKPDQLVLNDGLGGVISRN